MEEFRFNIDQKCTIWSRDHYNINAESHEEAKNKMIALIEAGKLDEIEIEYSETLDETLEIIDNQDSINFAFELIDYETDDTLYSN